MIPFLGVARQCRAIIQGLQNCVSKFTDDVKDIEAKEVIDVLLFTNNKLLVAFA